MKLKPMIEAPVNGEFWAFFVNWIPGQRMEENDCIVVQDWDDQEKPFSKDELCDDDFGMINITIGYVGPVYIDVYGRLHSADKFTGWLDREYIWLNDNCEPELVSGY